MRRTRAPWPRTPPWDKAGPNSTLRVATSTRGWEEEWDLELEGEWEAGSVLQWAGNMASPMMQDPTSRTARERREALGRGEVPETTTSCQAWEAKQRAEGTEEATAN